jgi:uncharacterized membrane protein YcjF (UPF0283 family)
MSFGEVLWTAFLVFIWVAWIWLVITVLIDIFRSDDLSGWGKAGWTILVVFLTWIGVLAYLIVRGHGMQERRLREAAHMRRAQEEYIRDVAGGGSGGTADELSKLADLRDKGVISEDEFQSQKSRLLS